MTDTNDWIVDPDRDPAVDHPHELYPTVQVVDDLSDVLDPGDGRHPPVQVVGDNVDDDGVAHFLRITSDGDHCGGCGKEWPCDKRVGLDFVQTPEFDPEIIAAVQHVLNERR